MKSSDPAIPHLQSWSRPLPNLREFSRRFKRKYGRLMTQDERRFFHLIADVIENPPKPAEERDSQLSTD